MALLERDLRTARHQARDGQLSAQQAEDELQVSEARAALSRLPSTVVTLLHFNDQDLKCRCSADACRPPMPCREL